MAIPLAPLIKGGLGLASSFIQNISANKSRKKADAAMPGAVDPRQAAFLAELNQKRKAIDTGADFGAGMSAIDRVNASTNEAITRASGGDVGATIQGLLGAQRTAGDNMNNVLAQGQGQQLAMNSMYGALNDKIAARTLQLGMQKSQQNRAEWAQKKQTANQNMQGALGGLLSGLTQPPPAMSSDMGGSMEGIMSGLPTATEGDMASAPNLGGGGEFPELMGGAASGNMDTSFLDNLK